MTSALRPVEVKGHWLWGMGERFAEDPLSSLTEMSRLGDVVSMRFGPFRVYQLNRVEHVRRVLQNPRIYGKQTVSYRRLRLLLGLGLLTSDGDFWLRQRRIAQPAFHKDRIAGFGAAMARAATALADRWQTLAERGEAIDLGAEMTRVTLSIVCETLLGGDVGDAGERVSRSFTVLNEITSDRLNQLMPLPLWVPTAPNRHYRAALAELDQTVYEIIARRRASDEETHDLLSMLMRARDVETGAAMTDRQLRDEVTTILLAGHETTAVALTWAFYLLSQNPDAERRLHQELAEVLDGREPALADLDRLPWTRQVIDETLRLYPPVWGMDRSVHADDELDGYHVRRGISVLISPWVMHRSPSLWSEPEAFRPERFAPGETEVPRYAYFPFLGGPRQCIGSGFAMMEAQLLLATLAQRWRLELSPGARVEPLPLLTLRPKCTVSMQLRPVEQPPRAAA
jgi:cytochrome P450